MYLNEICFCYVFCFTLISVEVLVIVFYFSLKIDFIVFWYIKNNICINIMFIIVLVHKVKLNVNEKFCFGN